MKEETNGYRRRANVIKFPGKRHEERPYSRLYYLSTDRNWDQKHFDKSYNLVFFSKDKDDKFIYGGPKLAKLAKKMVDDLPTLDTTFMIETQDVAFLLGHSASFSASSAPSDKVLYKIQRLVDKEIRKRKGGWKGVTEHYKIRLWNYLNYLNDRYFWGLE